MTDRFDLSRRKLLGAMGTIGGAAALGGASTMAFFSDSEEFANNRLVAGELDMKAAYSEHYSDWSDDEDDGGVSVRMHDGPPGTTGDSSDLESGETGLPTNDAWLIAVDDPDTFLLNTLEEASGDVTQPCPAGTDAADLSQPVIDLGDVKPGDFGEVTFDFRLCDNPGYVWLQGGVRTASENGLTEPEDKDGEEDRATDPVDPAHVELLDVVQAAYWIDDGNNYQNGNESVAFAGSLRDVLSRLSSGKGSPLSGDTPAPEGGGTGRNCFSGDDTHSVAFAWWVPVDHGNEIQGDSVTFDLGFYTEQCRHNGGGTSIVSTDGSGDFSSIQAAIDASGPGDEIVVRAGTYEETIDVQDTSGLTIRGDSTVTVKPQTTISWGSETNFPGRTTAIRVVNASDVAFRNLTFDFEDVDDTAICGLLFWESDGEIWHSTLTGMSNANDAVDLTSYLGTNDPGSSVYSDSNRARIDIRNTEFVETGRIGINAEDFVHAVVADSSFETTDAGYAVEVGSEATGIVRRNEIHGYDTDFSDGSESAGIYVENAFPSASGVVKHVDVVDNEVYDCTVGIRIGNEFHTITGDVDIEARLVNNFVHDNDTGVSVTDSGAEDGSSVSVVGSDNTLENNGDGYHIFEGNSVSEDDDGNITVDVDRESITDNDVGVLVESTSASPVTSFQSVTVTGSNVENNTSFGIQNDVGNLTVDAENNWWGAGDGPSGQGSGSGDAVSSNVDFDPFAGSPNDEAGD
jgi:predicted ribosomally synthesized peptide with SipW-like signal peptide